MVFWVFFDDTDYTICLDYRFGARKSDCVPSGRQMCVSAGPGVLSEMRGVGVGRVEGVEGEGVPGSTFSSRYVFTSLLE